MSRSANFFDHLFCGLEYASWKNISKYVSFTKWFFICLISSFLQEFFFLYIVFKCNIFLMSVFMLVSKTNAFPHSGHLCFLYPFVLKAMPKQALVSTVFSPNQPTGAIRSSSRNVYIYIYGRTCLDGYLTNKLGIFPLLYVDIGDYSTTFEVF